MARTSTLTASGQLVLDRRTAAGPHCPSGDVLLHSIAAAAGRNGVAVVLSGMGTDGAAGAAAVHRAGGLAIAQDETSSAVFGMPRAAIDLGVDVVLPPGEIASQLRRLRSPAAGRSAVVTGLAEIRDLDPPGDRDRAAARPGGGLLAALDRAAPGLGPEAFVRAAANSRGGHGLVNRLIDEVTVQETAFVRDRHQLDAIDWPGLWRAARGRGPGPDPRLERRVRERGGGLHARAARGRGVRP